MIGLQNRITVTVIRNAAGAHLGSIEAGCGATAPTYYTAAKTTFGLPSACGDNTRGLYDPAMPHKVINVMNYFGAPSSDFVPFDRTDMVNPIDLQCELEAGDEIICIWKPLLVLNPNVLVGTSQPSVGTRVVPLAPVPVPPSNSAPSEPPPVTLTEPETLPKVTIKHSSKSKWLPTYGIFFQPPQPPEV